MAAEISFKNIKRHDVQKIGMAYINHLVEKGDYDSAARWVGHVVNAFNKPYSQCVYVRDLTSCPFFALLGFIAKKLLISNVTFRILIQKLNISLQVCR